MNILQDDRFCYVVLPKEWQEKFIIYEQFDFEEVEEQMSEMDLPLSTCVAFYIPDDRPGFLIFMQDQNVLDQQDVNPFEETG